MLDAARREATSVLLDQRLFLLDEETFEALHGRPRQVARVQSAAAPPSRHEGSLGADRAGDEVGAPEHLDAAHDLAAFDPGVAGLDDWLRERALANEENGPSRTYVISVAGRVVGYYSLATAPSSQQRAAGKGAAQHDRTPMPVMVLGRLAVDKAYQGERSGQGLAARRRLAHAAGRGDWRHSSDRGSTPSRREAKRFYERCGFSPSPMDPMTLMVGIADVERILRDR